MRTHTSQFKDEIKQYGRQFNDTIYYNNTTYDGEHIFSINYSVDTTLCKSVMQTLKIDTDIPMNVGDTLDYGISVEGATDEIRFNNFIVNKIEEQKDKKSNLVTCYDNMIKSMVDYESLGVTYPITVRSYLSAICTKLGLTFKNASDTFTNYDKNITSEHYIDSDGNSMGYTFRDVLDDLAEVVGGFICIDNNGQLEIKGFTNTQDTINEDYFSDKNVNIGKKVGPYNVVVLSRASDSDNIHYPATLPSNPIEFKISDNAILDQDNREDFIQGIYNNINGLEFYLNDFVTTGILYYEIGDMYDVSIDNNTYTCLMLSDNIKRTTGLKENIHTDEPKQSVTDYKYSSTTDKLEISGRNAKILVDKANASIEQIVSAVGDNGQVTSASIIQSINDDTSSIKLEADKIDINGVVSANNNFVINQDGSVEINNGTLVLTDTTSSYGTSKLTITGTYGGNDYDVSLYSNALMFFSQYSGYSIIRNFGDEGIFLIKVADDNSYRTENFLLHNQILMTSNNNTTFEVDGTTGDTTINGKLNAVNGIYSRPPGEANTPIGNSQLIVKRVTVGDDTGVPNNGVILEYGNSTSWVGQLYIGDNANQGIYYNGWSSGTRGNWKKLAFENMFDISRGTATFDSSYISSVERNHYEKSGKIVTFEFTITVTGTWNNTTKFASGLPKPVSDIRFMAINAVTNQPLRIGLWTSGELANAYSQQPPSSGNVIEGRVTYITND